MFSCLAFINQSTCTFENMDSSKETKLFLTGNAKAWYFWNPIFKSHVMNVDYSGLRRKVHFELIL